MSTRHEIHSPRKATEPTSVGIRIGSGSTSSRYSDHSQRPLKCRPMRTRVRSHQGQSRPRGGNNRYQLFRRHHGCWRPGEFSYHPDFSKSSALPNNARCSRPIPKCSIPADIPKNLSDPSWASLPTPPCPQRLLPKPQKAYPVWWHPIRKAGSTARQFSHYRTARYDDHDGKLQASWHTSRIIEFPTTPEAACTL
jgi:hypothetical protein